MMKVARLFGPKDIRYIEMPIPEIGDHDVLIKVKYCGVCATDYSIYSGESSFIEAGLVNFPMTLGHEYSGVIEAIGSKVTRFKVGDRVVSDTGISCGICDACREGNYLRCDKMQAVGTINAKDGGYAEYTSMPERHVFNLPEEIPFEIGALVEPVATGFYAIKQGDVQVGDNVLIIGSGAIGLGGVPFARFSGAKNVILAARKDFKLEIGKKMGADITINTVKENLYERVMEITDGKGVEVIVESSGNADMFIQSTKLVASGGRIAVVAFYEQLINGVDLDLFVLKDAKITAVSGSPNMGPVVIKMMETGKMDFSHMITKVYPLAQAEDALNELKTSSDKRIKIMLKI